MQSLPNVLIIVIQWYAIKQSAIGLPKTASKKSRRRVTHLANANGNTTMNGPWPKVATNCCELPTPLTTFGTSCVLSWFSNIILTYGQCVMSGTLGCIRKTTSIRLAGLAGLEPDRSGLPEFVRNPNLSEIHQNLKIRSEFPNNFIFIYFLRNFKMPEQPVFQSFSDVWN